MPPRLRPGPSPVPRTPVPTIPEGAGSTEGRIFGKANNLGTVEHLTWPASNYKGIGNTEGRIFGEPTTLEKPASRVASQQLLKEPTAPKDVSSKKSTTPEELTTSRIPGCNVSRSKGMRLVE
ncbi:hypothetical protein E4U61_007070 [Claviceps capensis]|nr:hypothetical protein E4U61_007070 [Claviceps capensis]